MYSEPAILVITILSYILLGISHHHLIAFVDGGNSPYYIGDVAINCGSIGNSTALDGREWIGEEASKFMYSSLQPKGKSKSSTSLEKTFYADPIPSMTSRISATPFHYTFQVTPGSPIVGQRNRFYSIDNRTALQVIYRLNVGGNFISSVEDFGMFRRWNEDSDYLLESRVHRVNYPVLSIKYPAFIAPPKLYETSWKTEGNLRLRVHQMYKITWKLPIYMGFGYLVRLHFCELDAGMVDREQTEFTIIINDQIAETQVDVIRWSGGTGIPVFRDYVVIMKGGNEGSKCDILITLQSFNERVFGLLRGLEIFKLSNLENSLAIPNPTIPRKVSSSSYLENQNMSFAFGHGSVSMTGMTILIILVNVIVYKLRQIWEEKFHVGKETEVATTESYCHRFSFAEIMLATRNFSDALVIGKGGFGKVYKGFIHGIPEIVAVKRLKSDSKQGAQEFRAEIETLSKLRHIHLVSLIGYCNEYQEMILVYEYMPRGTLADNLYKFGNKERDCTPLSWEKRLRICIGAARGLEYLHTSSETGVIHRDVKDSNILLDENFVAKISDFGLSRLERINKSKSYVSTNVKGTTGYLDPDYCMTQRLTRKSDVYSYGVVLLVVLSGRRAVSIGSPEEQRSLLSSFRECIEGGAIERMVDPSLQGKIPSNSLTEFVKCVKNCLQYEPKKRPTMAQVVASLEYALEQQESPIFTPMFSVSEDAIPVGQPLEIIESFQLVHNEYPPILEESVISHPKQVITSKPIQNITSTSDGKNLQLREKYSVAPVRKPSMGWLWKAGWNIGKQTRRTNFILPTGSGSRFSVEDIQAAMDISTGHHFIIDGEFRKVSIGHMKQHPELAFSVYQFAIGGRRRKEVLDACSEIERLSQLRHPNLLSLMGYCHDKPQNQILLLYEHIGFGTLHSYLYGSKTNNHLQWKHRLKIGIGVAQGLDYLHKGTKKTIIHYNVRPENIILNENLRPKILNSGLSKLGPVAHLEKARNETESAWLEYLSPEAMTPGFQSSEKSDVYSFGLVLLELLCSQKTKNFHLYSGNDERYLKHWVKNHIKTKKLEEAIDPSVEWEIASTCLGEFLKIAFSCLRFHKRERPSMSYVIEKLKFATQLQEKAEARFQDFMGNGLDGGFNLEDVYQYITPYLEYD